MTALLWIYCLIAFPLALMMTWGVRWYAIQRNVMDTPNERSSHTRPTPRGGGVAFVASFLLLGSLQLATGASSEGGIAFLGAGLLTAATGFLDDHGHIPARWRLLSHFGAAAWALYWLGGAPPVELWGLSMSSNTWWGLIGLALFLVWMLNLYNFMDGIDGLASVQAITVASGGALVYFLTGHEEQTFYPLLLALSVAGFLVWNFPPARIFMGDAGSGFLGIILGALTVQAGWVDPSLFWAWLILSAAFITDATFTLARRLCRGEKAYEAHRSHAYQHASRQLGRHRPVTLTVLALNLVLLWPLALAVGTGSISPFWGLAAAYAPLLALAIAFKAGKSEVSA